MDLDLNFTSIKDANEIPEGEISDERAPLQRTVSTHEDNSGKTTSAGEPTVADEARTNTTTSRDNSTTEYTAAAAEMAATAEGAPTTETADSAVLAYVATPSQAATDAEVATKGASGNSRDINMEDSSDSSGVDDFCDAQDTRGDLTPEIPPASKTGVFVSDVPSVSLQPTVQLLAPTSSPSKDRLSFSQQQMDIMSPSKNKAIVKKPSDANGPRLTIHKLVLTNFKSYAGVQEIGPFNASFSAVVGPNGSGKSNVIDSLLFVFGFRALKMRQGKLSELIHNSSADQNIEYCQVDIHFVHVLDDPVIPAKSSTVPNSDLVISRRAFKTNGSQYYINNRSSTYTDVTSYLRGQGIDLDHKRFLILQGEVESIAQMKAKAEKENDDGLLEYLEDIIGTSNYKQAIDESLVKIEDMNQICLEKETRFELVETDTKSMEDKKNEALRFLKAEKALIDKKSIKFQVDLHEGRAALEKSESLATSISEKLAQEAEQNQALRDEHEAALEGKSNIANAFKDLQKEVAQLVKKQKSYNSQTVSLEEKLKNLGNKIKKITKAKASSESALSSARMSFENMNSANEKFRSELKELEESLEIEREILGTMRQNLTEKTSHFSREIQTLQTKLEPYNDSLKSHDGQIELTMSEISMLQNQKEALDMKIRQASQRLVDIKAEGKAKELELEALEKKAMHIDEQIELGEEQCNAFKKNLEGKKVRLASARLKTQDAISELSSIQNKSKVLVSLTKLLRSGRITGLHGRLGDLGQIDDKYDVAISTACPALDSMVVETVETAQICIDYLRKNQLGYANFICLDKLRHFNMNPIKTPGNSNSVKRLFDLISPKDTVFLPAFYSKLRDTLVAGNLQEAKSVAYGPTRYKVVTLDGKVVDTSGTMSGGGNLCARGGMKLKSNASQEQDVGYSEEDVQQMREELLSMEQSVEGAGVELHEMETNLRKLKDLKPETEFAMQTIQLDIQALVSEKKEVSENCKSLIAEKEMSIENSEVDKLIEAKQNELEVMQKKREDIKLQMLESETRVILLEEKIMEAGGVELKVQNSKFDSIKQQIDIIQQKTSGDHMTMKKLENDIKRHEKNIANCDSELLATQEESASVEEERKMKLAESRELAEKLESVEVDLNAKESEISEFETKIEELAEKMNEFKSEEIELRNQLDKVKAQAKRHCKSIADAQGALEGLIVRDTGPYIDWMPEDQRPEYNGAEIKQLTPEELESILLEYIEDEITGLKNYMDEVKVDVEVLKEYGIKQVELKLRRDELNESVEKRDSIKNYSEDLKKRRLDEFMEGFNTISMSLKEMYQMITMGGNAELELVDSLDPFSEGILFSVMPPKKSWKNISNLSGGEKTLSSLALVFALHKYKPTPLYVMDEIDAALDFRNVSIVANYIKERTKNAQFVVISLRNNMFELAQQLVGIYKVNNMTRSISLQNRELFDKEKPEPEPVK